MGYCTEGTEHIDSSIFSHIHSASSWDVDQVLSWRNRMAAKKKAASLLWECKVNEVTKTATPTSGVYLQ